VCTILRQVIENHPPPQRQSLLETFLEEILAPIDGSKLDELPADPTEAFQSILCLSALHDLWNDLGQVLGEATYLERQNMPQNTRHLTIVFDLDSPSGEAGRALMESFRGVITDLRGHYTTVRLLVTNPSVTGDPGPQLPSEVLLEYDKERQGL
jgi:hypothetical protein